MQKYFHGLIKSLNSSLDAFMNAKEVNDIFNIPLVLIETDATSNVCFAETFHNQVCTQKD